jgi:hypothetical protein
VDIVDGVLAANYAKATTKNASFSYGINEVGCVYGRQPAFGSDLIALSLLEGRYLRRFTATLKNKMHQTINRRSAILRCEIHLYPSWPRCPQGWSILSQFFDKITVA